VTPDSGKNVEYATYIWRQHATPSSPSQISTANTWIRRQADPVPRGLLDMQEAPQALQPEATELRSVRATRLGTCISIISRRHGHMLMNRNVTGQAQMARGQTYMCLH
jgi:hypothetical protein